MAVSFPVLLAEKLILEDVIRLLPLLPLPTVLVLEQWAVSRFEFSRAGVVTFRAVYLLGLFWAICSTYILGMTLWN